MGAAAGAAGRARRFCARVKRGMRRLGGFDTNRTFVVQRILTLAYNARGQSRGQQRLRRCAYRAITYMAAISAPGHKHLLALCPSRHISISPTHVHRLLPRLLPNISHIQLRPLLGLRLPRQLQPAPAPPCPPATRRPPATPPLPPQPDCCCLPVREGDQFPAHCGGIGDEEGE